MMPAQNEATSEGCFVTLGRRLLVLDSVTEAVGIGAGCVVVSGSHGGLSAGRFAIDAQVWLAVFNDAGVGKDGAGIAALALLQSHGVAACTVAHDSARIGEARSTLQDGMVSYANAAAEVAGARVGQSLASWLRPASVEPVPSKKRGAS